jgi:hypothetical protein
MEMTEEIRQEIKADIRRRRLPIKAHGQADAEADEMEEDDMIKAVSRGRM